MSDKYDLLDAQEILKDAFYVDGDGELVIQKSKKRY